MHKHTSKHTHTYIHIRTHTYIHTHPNTHIHTYTSEHTHTYIHILTHTYIHTHTNIHIHANTSNTFKHTHTIQEPDAVLLQSERHYSGRLPCSILFQVCEHVILLCLRPSHFLQVVTMATVFHLTLARQPVPAADSPFKHTSCRLHMYPSCSVSPWKQWTYLLPRVPKWSTQDTHAKSAIRQVGLHDSHMTLSGHMIVT